MKWIAISGSWRKTNREIEEKLRSIVKDIIFQGNGIVSGGALGVDFISLEEALKWDPKAERIKIFLPTTFKIYAKHYRKHVKLGSITKEQAENLISQLTKLKNINPRAIIENHDVNFTEGTKKEMYYERNSKIVEASDELIAFRIKTKVSQGAGTANAIEKAKKKGIPIKLFEYNFME